MNSSNFLFPEGNSINRPPIFNGVTYHYFSYFLLVRQTHDISIKFVHNYWTDNLYPKELNNWSPCGDDLFL